jgi:hypothetical protein
MLAHASHLGVSVYARDCGPVQLVVVWRAGVTSARWVHTRTGAMLGSAAVARA